MITIRPFQRADRDALYDMLAPIWPTETAESLDRRWWWQHDVPPLTVAEDETGALAGMVGAIPFVASANGREHRGAWIVDFFVSKQGLGIGKKMVASVEPQYDFLASLNQTDAAWAAFKRLGWTERTFAPLFLLPLPLAYRMLTTGRRRAATSTSTSPISAAAFGPEFDALWDKARTDLGAASVRAPGTLSKRFTGARRGEVLVRANGGTGLDAYAIVRELPAGSIRSFSGFPILMVSDYLAPPGRGDLFGSLMDAVVAHARARGIRFVLCMSTQPAHQQWLRRSGFLSVHTPVVGERLRKLDVGFTATPSAPAGPWHLTPFDCDLDILFGGQA